MDFSPMKKKLAESRLPIYETVTLAVLEAIESGDWPAGFRLPSDKAMAAEFGISHITLAKALNKLRAMGLLQRRRALGTFVSPPLQEGVEHRRSIAVVFDFADATTFQQNLFLELHKKLEEAGLTLVFFSSDGSSMKQLSQLKSIVRDPILKGCVFWSILNAEQARELVEWTPRYFPLVFMDKYYEGIRHDAATYDNFGSARELGRFLRRKKRKNVVWAFSEDQKFSSTIDRFNGLCDGFGETVRQYVMNEKPYSGVAPDCFVFSSEVVYNKYRSRFGEPPAACTFATVPGYPGICFDVRSMADVAVSVLLRRINGDDAPSIHATGRWTLDWNSTVSTAEKIQQPIHQ